LRRLARPLGRHATGRLFLDQHPGMNLVFMRVNLPQASLD
jgi:hypothetical protein